MPQRFEGTKEARLLQLDQQGRRCDANNRFCATPAVEEFRLQRTNGNGVVLPHAEIIVRKCCGRHRVQFLQNAQYALVSRRSLTERPTYVRKIA